MWEELIIRLITDEAEAEALLCLAELGNTCPPDCRIITVIYLSGIAYVDLQAISELIYLGKLILFKTVLRGL